MSYPNDIRIANLSNGEDYFKWYCFTMPFNLFEWLKQDHMVHDTDNDGDDVSYYAVVDRDGTHFFRLTHEWYWTDYHSDDRELCNDFTWQEVGKEELPASEQKCLRFVV